MIQFGTGGWRAVIGSDFIERNICLVTEGICALMREEEKADKPIVLSSPSFPGSHLGESFWFSVAKRSEEC